MIEMNDVKKGENMMKPIIPSAGMTPMISPTPGVGGIVVGASPIIGAAQTSGVMFAPDHGMGAPASIVARGGVAHPCENPILSKLSPERLSDLRSHATALVNRVASDPIREDMPGMLGRAGVEPNGTVDFLKQRVGKMISSDNESAVMMKSLAKLRTLMDKLNPEQIEKERKGIGASIVRLIKRIPFADDVLATLKSRFTTVEGAIDDVIGGLRMQREQLQRDIVQLDEFSRSLDGKLEQVAEAINMGEIINEQVVLQLAEEQDPSRSQALTELRRRVTMRIEDLEVVRQLFHQSKLSAIQTAMSNDDLADAIARTVSTSELTLPVLLSIQVAMHRQKTALSALDATRKYQGDLVLANAVALKKGTEAVAKAGSAPTVEVDKVKQAYTMLISAIDDSSQRMDLLEKEARGTIAVMRDMSDSLEQRLKKLRNSQQTKAQLPDSSISKGLGE